MEFNQLKQKIIDLNKSVNELELHKFNKEQKGELEKLLVETIESYSVRSDINISSLINSNKSYQQELHSILDTITNYASHDFSNEFENNEFETLHILKMAIQMLGEDLKASNMKVLHTEELFQIIFNNSPLSIVKMDENLSVLDMNNSFCDFIGASKSELLGSNLSEFTHPEDLKKDKQNLSKLISGENKNFTKVKRYISKSGEILWGQINACAVVTDEGAFQYFIGMIKDITKEKEAELALLASKTQLSNIYHSTKEMMGLVKVDGDKFIFISANKSALKSFKKSGISECDYIGKELRDHAKNILSLCDDHIDKIENCYKKVLATREILEAEPKEIVINNIYSIYIQTTYSPIIDENGTVSHILWSARDVSESHAFTEKISKSEKLLKEAQRIGKFGHWQLDLVTNKLSWSDQQYLIWGIDKDKMEASYEGFLNSIHPEDREMVNAAYENSLKTKTPYNITHRLLMDDGEVKYVKEICETKYNDKGEPLVSVGSTQDVTKEIVQENIIQQSLEEKETLLKEVHHRVKNNLQIISGLLEMQSYRTNNDIVKKELGESKTRIKSIALIHEQLYQSNDFNSVDLKEYVDQLLIEITSIYSLQDNLISIKNSISNINVNINKAIPIGLILNELITNATKHAFVNPNRDNLITIIASEANGSLCLNIEDNGIGFKDPFNVDRITTMGLKMIHALVGQLDAECKIESDSSGTKFNIDIPL